MSTPAPTALAAPVPVPPGGRVQLALDVDDLAASIAFYTALLGTPPAKVREGYANFAVASPALKLVLFERPGSGGRLNHLGVELPDADAVRGELSRAEAAGLVPEAESEAVCCYAEQEKSWLTAPSGERWELYTVLADSPTFAGGPADACPCQD